MSNFINVACDESGNEGENLTRAGSKVFSHASVSITSDVAYDLIEDIRQATGSKSDELKSSVLIRPSNRDVLEWLLDEPRLVEKTNVHLTEKRFFVSGKVIDLIVETLMHERNHDLYRAGRARDMAYVLYNDAPGQLGPDWDTALDEFNTMLRARVRKGSQATLDDFYGTLDAVRPLAQGKLAVVLRLVHAGRGEAAALIRDMPVNSLDYLSLDPLFAALGQTARTWHERSGLPVRIVHDETSLLTKQRIEALKKGLSEPIVTSLGVDPVPLQAVTLVDSQKNPRVQVADLLAGVGRSVAEIALSGEDSLLCEKLRPHVDPFSIWGDGSSWKTLMGDPQ